MEYNKYDLKKFNLHIIKTKEFKTITTLIALKTETQKENVTIRRLLTETLLNSSLKYPSQKLIEMETEELYGLSLSTRNIISGKYDIMTFKTTFLNEKWTEEGMNKRSILFLLQILFNPDVIDDKFNDYGFDIAKRLILNDIKSIEDYPSSYATQRMFEVMDKNHPFAFRNAYLKDLKKISTSDLYKYYKKAINNDIMDIFVIGDVDDNEMLQLFKDNIYRETNNTKSGEHFVEVKKTNKIKEKKENKKINQSRLNIACTIDTLDDFEKYYVLNVYSFILGGSGDSLLFRKVREENSLCYSISSIYNIISNLVIIKAGIDKENYQKTVSLIKECLEKIKKGEFDDNEIEKAKTIYKSGCLELLDSPNSIINNYLTHEYLNTDLIENRIKKINKVTKEMVIELAKKVSVNTIYMLEGEQNDTKN